MLYTTVVAMGTGQLVTQPTCPWATHNQGQLITVQSHSEVKYLFTLVSLIYR